MYSSSSMVKMSRSSRITRTTISCCFVFVVVSVLLQEIEAQDDIEPYLVNWCMRQFPGQFDKTSVTSVSSLRHLPVEPFLEDWCFEQFPGELYTLEDSNEVTGKGGLFTSHIRIEPSLQKWSEQTIKDNYQYHLEPYVGSWCTQQLLSVRDFSGFDELTKKTTSNKQIVPVETAFGRWCFATFPEELGNTFHDSEATIAKLYTSFVPIEDDILTWYFASLKKAESLSTPMILLLSASAAFVLSMIVVFLLIPPKYKYPMIRGALTKQRATTPPFDHHDDEEQEHPHNVEASGLRHAPPPPHDNVDSTECPASPEDCYDSLQLT